MLKNYAKKFLPPGTKRFKLAKEFGQSVGVLDATTQSSHYSEWVLGTEAYTWSKVRELKFNPVISIITPVYNVPASYLLQAVHSVIAQKYDSWELILINASTDNNSRRVTKECQLIDRRIKVVDVKNQGIAGNTNIGIAKATGSYIALLDHDDMLAPHALYESVLALQAENRPSVVYSDEDKISDDSSHRYDPHFKPDWSLHLMRHVNYMNHFMVIEKKLIDKIGGYNEGLDGAQDYDLFLRLIDQKPVIAHVPKVLYHWRAVPTSTAQNFSSKKNVLEAGTKALQDHLERNKQKGFVKHVANQPGYYKVSYDAPEDADKQLAIIVKPAVSADQYSEFIKALSRVVKKSSKAVEIFTSNMKGNKQFLNNNPQVKNISGRKDKFVYEVLKQTNEPYIIVLDSAALPISKHWLDELIGLVSEVPEVGVVCPLVLDKTECIIVGSAMIKSKGELVDLYANYPVKAHTYLGNTDWPRNVDAFNDRVYLIRRDILEKESGSDSRTISQQLISRGIDIVFWPQVRFASYGDMQMYSEKAHYFNESLMVRRQELDVSKMVFMRPGDPNDQN